MGAVPHRSRSSPAPVPTSFTALRTTICGIISSTPATTSTGLPFPCRALRQNDFGGTLGGPILRDRTFFFFSYEGLRLLLPQTAIGTFYTAAARQNVAPAYQPLMAALPLPDGPVNSDGLTAPLTVGYSDPTSLNATSLRIDHTINHHLNIFGRYNHAPSTQSVRLWSEEQNYTDAIRLSHRGCNIRLDLWHNG